MEELSVTPEYLEQLARTLDEAVDLADRAKQKTADLHTEVWQGWGPLFLVSASQYTVVERSRRDGIGHIRQLCIELAAQLRSAANAYTSSDTLSGEKLDKQILTS